MVGSCAAVFIPACKRRSTPCARGIKICCITNKRYAFSHELLVAAGIRDYFDRELRLRQDRRDRARPSPRIKSFVDLLATPGPQ
jgi:FMN phosphatase YigB (HAD superfamily)